MGVGTDGVTTLKPDHPSAYKPPRLATSLNELKLQPDRSSSSGNNTQKTKGLAPTAAEVKEVIDWICGTLDDDETWGKVWSAPSGQHPTKKVDDEEETWAKLMDELFLGCAYSGSSMVAGFLSMGYGASQTYIYSRFEAEDAEGKANSDPAYPIAVACQHLTTHGALARGIKLKPQLNNAGIPASQRAVTLSVFKDGPGKWYTNKPIRILGVEAPVDAAAFEITTNAVAFDAKAAKKKLVNFGPGTVYTYNPMLHTEYTFAEVREEQLVRNAKGEIDFGEDGSPRVQPGVAQQTELAAQDLKRSIASLGLTVSIDTATALSVKNDPTIPEAEKNKAGVYTAKLMHSAQLDGSHASMILRIYDGRDASGNASPVVQLLDTSAHTEGAAADYYMFSRPGQEAGIFASEARATVPGEQGKFVGLGTLPPLTSDAEKHLEAMRKARPVGLARLVVARAPADAKTEMGEDDILFVSRMIPMWSRQDPKRNYSIARLLLSLRNTPYHASLRAFWVMYAPCGALAEVMWATGARSKTLDTMAGEAVSKANELADPKKPALKPGERENADRARTRLATGLDTLPVAIVSHDSAGLAQQIWRNHLAPVGQGTPPKIMRELFIETRCPSIAFLQKKLKELDNAYRAERDRRGKKAKDLSDAIKAAQKKGDAEEAKRLEAERTALGKAPYESVPELKEMGKTPFADKFVSKLTPYRDNPLSCYTADLLSQPASIELPAMLR